ncbi:MAG: hypothetical protein AB7E81_00610 [Hyphomicrobiaceae bacterium]
MAACLLSILAGTGVCAQGLSAVPPPSAEPVALGNRRLLLGVVINGYPTTVIVSLKEEPGHGLIATAEDLAAAGLKQAEQARRSDGNIELDKLPGVTYRVDESAQLIHFETADSARIRRTVNARRQRRDNLPEPHLDYGAMLNYSLFGATDALSDFEFARLDTFSGSFDLRLFGPYGTLSNSFIAGRAGDWLEDVVRLRTAWVIHST